MYNYRSVFPFIGTQRDPLVHLQSGPVWIVSVPFCTPSVGLPFHLHVATYARYLYLRLFTINTTEPLVLGLKECRVERWLFILVHSGVDLWISLSSNTFLSLFITIFSWNDIYVLKPPRHNSHTCISLRSIPSTLQIWGLNSKSHVFESVFF